MSNDSVGLNSESLRLELSEELASLAGGGLRSLLSVRVTVVVGQ